ncbi:hypothetical protein RJJ65_30930, partial [Rhizobium hidalgonense]
PLTIAPTWGGKHGTQPQLHHLHGHDPLLNSVSVVDAFANGSFLQVERSRTTDQQVEIATYPFFLKSRLVTTSTEFTSVK